MTSKIEIVREHLGHRIEGEPREDGKWLVWDCRFSAQTMDKFVGRCKRDGVTAFFRAGRFGVLASDLA
jgi:hypothetical protein